MATFRQHALSRSIPERAGLGARFYALAGGISIALAASVLDTAPVLGSLAGSLAAPLEARFSRPEIGNGRAYAGIVVLGGGLARLQEAGRLARQHAHLKVFASGAGSREFVRRALGQGIDPRRIAVEQDSTSTFENAVNSKKHVDPRPNERWLLVTSAVHMPRSVGAFRRVGFEVEAWPVYDLGEIHPERHYSIVRHEWVGLAYYWLGARSSALLPGPRPVAR